MDICTFDNEDIISVDSVIDKDKLTKVEDELDHGEKLYNERLLLKKKTKDIVLQPLYIKDQKKKYRQKKIAVYKLCCFSKIVKPSAKREYPECNHYGNIILDRDILTRAEYDTFLAQPKQKSPYDETQQRCKVRCCYVKKYLPDSTARIEELAIPDRKRLIAVIEEYSKVLTARQLDYIRRILLREDFEFTDIERAISLHREENKKKLIRKAQILREAAKVKRKIIRCRKKRIEQIAKTIFAIMECFLLTEHKIDLSEGMKKLATVIECKIIEFAGYKNCNDITCEFIKNLAQNLTIWIDKFISNFGFDSLKSPMDFIEDTGGVCPCEEKEMAKLIPIDDYIELSDDKVEEEEEEQEEEEDAIRDWFDVEDGELEFENEIFGPPTDTGAGGEEGAAAEGDEGGAPEVAGDEPPALDPEPE